MIDSKLRAAFRYWRHGNPRGKTVNARAALMMARQDVANGEDRYPTDNYGPGWWRQKREPRTEFEKKYGRELLVCVEADRRWSGVRFVGIAPSERRAYDKHFSTTGVDGPFSDGWFTHPDGHYSPKDGDGLCWGVVYQLPARKGKAQFVPGYVHGGIGENEPTLDFNSIFEGNPREGDSCNTDPKDTDAAREAARHANQMAEKEAGREREYQTAWRAGSDWAELQTDIDSARKVIKELLAERKAARTIDPKAFPSICQAIRHRITDALAEIEEARAKRRKLADGDADELYFWPGDARLREAFNDGASEIVLAPKATR